MILLNYYIRQERDKRARGSKKVQIFLTAFMNEPVVGGGGSWGAREI